jgi:hypothetical protein
MTSRSTRWAGLVACIGKKRNSYRVLDSRLKGKRQFSIPKCRKEDNIKINLKQDGRRGIILIL